MGDSAAVLTRPKEGVHLPWTSDARSFLSPDGPSSNDEKSAFRLYQELEPMAGLDISMGELLK
jgi:hypothetical protein